MAINATNYDGTKDYKIAEVGDVYHPNLLVNGDFQVNQRGKDYYDTETGWAYGVDMWKSIYCNIGTGVENVIVVKSDSGYMQQKLSGPVSGDITVSVNVPYITKGEFEIYLEGGTSDETRLVVKGTGIFSHTFKSVSNATTLSIAFNGFYGNIDYIDLFEGSIAYPHVKESYALAMTRCLPWIETGNYVAYKEGHAYIMGFNYRCKKMSTPTITFGTGANADGVVSGTFTAVSQNIDSCPFIRHDGSVINGQITLPTTISCEPL